MSVLWIFIKPAADHPPRTPYVRVDRALASGLTAVLIVYVLLSMV